MPRSLLAALQIALGLALLLGVWAQVVVIPTVAADQVDAFPPYAPFQVPLVSAAVAYIACVQIGLVALLFLLNRVGKSSFFERPALMWVNVLVGVVIAATALTAGLFLFVTFADIPSQSDGMEVIGLWLQSGVAAVASVVLMLLTLVGRHLLVKAIALRTELDGVI